MKMNDTYFEQFILHVKVRILFWKFEATLCKYTFLILLYEHIYYLVNTLEFEEIVKLTENLEVEVSLGLVMGMLETEFFFSTHCLLLVLKLRLEKTKDLCFNLDQSELSHFSGGL